MSPEVASVFRARGGILRKDRAHGRGDWIMQAGLRGIGGVAARGPKRPEGNGLSPRADAPKRGLKYGMRRCKRRYRITLGELKRVVRFNHAS